MFTNGKCMIAAVAAIALFVVCGRPARAADEEKAPSVITGTVVDEDGKAVAEATVNLGPKRDPFDRKEPVLLSTATTDKDGKFALKLDPVKIPDADYQVRCVVGGKGDSVKVTVKDGKPDPAKLKLVLKPLPAAS